MEKEITIKRYGFKLVTTAPTLEDSPVGTLTFRPEKPRLLLAPHYGDNQLVKPQQLL